MVFFVSSWILPLLIWALVLPVVVATEQIQGRPQPENSGSSEPIRAPLGGDVILPCVVQPQINMEDLTVMWWRPEILVDPNWYVHLYPEKQHQEAQTMPSYAGRTEMFADGLKLGNVSLQIRNLKLSDDGRYRCIIPQLAFDTTIKLEVFEPISDDTLTKKQFPNLTTSDLEKGSHFHGLWIWFLVACISLILVAVGVAACYLKNRGQNPIKYSVAQSSPAPGCPA
ncbi:butyrophilin-like protein 8 [Gymnodraco acuticeps]|uniref:Butyrophilin-like protein 8 n=1 Tax=Gymnodraco acuticeps TaxID=8218 RepID=A0A6P8U8Z1_GYMAC|nr:butyrophilin-like protein 8 [Gymnodraco acuticeps]